MLRQLIGPEPLTASPEALLLLYLHVRMRGLMKPLCAHSAPHRCTRVFLLGAVLMGLLSTCHKVDPGVTEILRAAGNGDLATTRRSLDHNPSLASSKDEEGFTALHYAASYGYLEIAELLLAKNANVNAQTGKGLTPLHYAASRGHKEMLDLLLSQGAKVDARDGVGCTPLYDAATSGHIEQVRELLTAKADVNAATLRGYTPLSGAASHGREEIVRLLIENRANVNAADLDGGTPLYWARTRGYDRIQDLLRQHGGLELPNSKPEWPYP